MAKICCLPSHVADLIAAGEVVERPASVVKELIENSIDAGASQITVEIQNGGIGFLRVTDNGCGMSREDAPTAFLRHATSKVRSEEDLEAIGTLGFRGEALAATASVSRIDLMTKQPGDLAGTSLHLEGGDVTRNEEAGCPDGTTIIVRDLFYNTPARMKFLKRDTVEGAAVFAAVQRQALAHPEISFHFLREGKDELRTSGDGQLMSAVYAVLGRKDALEMLEVESQWQGIRLKGYVTRPIATRGTRGYQHFFLNGRYIRNRILSMALEEAYKNQIMAGRFPACVLHITMPKESVDVNVHPAKTEVKFLSEREVFDAIHYGVLSTLSRASGKVPMQTPKVAEPTVSLPQYAPQPQLKAQPSKPAFQTMTVDDWNAMHRVLREDTKPLPPKVVEKVLARPEPKPEPKPEPMPEPEQQTLQTPDQPFRIVGEVLDTYIIVEQNQQVLFIDKHAAHERINFERLKAQQHPIMGQLLLEPVVCSLSREETAAVLQNRQLLLSLGYDADDLGDAVILRQIPSDVAIGDAEASLSELAGILLSGRRLDAESLRDELLHSIACKAAIKAGWHTEPAEREALVRQVLGRDDLKYCPHGRPICMTLSKKQIEKQFKRT